MSRTAPKVVYDCNVFVQALINLAEGGNGDASNFRN